MWITSASGRDGQQFWLEHHRLCVGREIGPARRADVGPAVCLGSGCEAIVYIRIVSEGTTITHQFSGNGFYLWRIKFQVFCNCARRGGKSCETGKISTKESMDILHARLPDHGLACRTNMASHLIKGHCSCVTNDDAAQGAFFGPQAEAAFVQIEIDGYPH